MKKIVLSLAALALAACAGESHTHDDGDHVHAAGGVITVSGAAARLPLPGQTTGAAYFTLENAGEANRLLGASSPVAGAVELHTHLNEGGVMKMRQVPAIELPAGQTVTLEPGGLHVMMFDMSLPEGTEGFDLTLDFETGEDVTLSIPVAKAAEGGYHSGH